MAAIRERATASLGEQAAFDEAVAIYMRKVADCRRKRLCADLLLLLSCAMLAACSLAPPAVRMGLLPIAFGVAWAGIHVGDRVARTRARLRW